MHRYRTLTVRRNCSDIVPVWDTSSVPDCIFPSAENRGAQEWLLWRVQERGQVGHAPHSRHTRQLRDISFQGDSALLYENVACSSLLHQRKSGKLDIR